MKDWKNKKQKQKQNKKKNNVRKVKNDVFLFLKSFF